MTFVTSPIGCDFHTWTSQIHQDLPDISIPIAGAVENWRDWAAQFITDNTLSTVPIPTVLAYPNTDDWKIWATYFIESVYNNN